MAAQADIALIGLAVMGENLVLNMESHGFTVAVFNRTVAKVDEFVKAHPGKKLIGAHNIDELVKSLKSPRIIMMMVRAGEAVDDNIKQLLPHLEKGDIIVDGGNSHYPDSDRRRKELEAAGLLFVGCGVSGGEDGARYGPSMMPGGSPAAWEHVKPIFQAISAKVEGDAPCCDWVGDGGSGHFVKMVHNGIEYGDMQLISEAYHLLSSQLGLSNEEMAVVFAEWNKGDLDSYLIEITRDILLKKRDDDASLNVVDVILDTAGQKGTGKWTAQIAMDLGMPVTLIGEAVFARCLSAQKSERVAASTVLAGPVNRPFEGDHEARSKFLTYVRDAIFAAKIVSYAQGYVLMRAAAKEYGWKLNYGAIALMWRGGCIIRSKFLGEIKNAFDKNPELDNLMLNEWFRDKLAAAQNGWRTVASIAVLHGIPLPAITTALAYYDGYRCARLPANLLQAQRDYFGAHTYERTDRERGQWFHTNWTGHGGTTASTTYTA